MNTLKKIFLLLLVFPTIYSAQNKLTSKADAYFESMSYVKSAKLYEKLVTKKLDSSQYVLERLGDSYYFNNNVSQSSLWYSKLMDMYESSVDSEYLFKYAQSLRGEKKYAASDLWMSKFKERKRQDQRGVNFTENKDELFLLTKQASMYQVSNASVLNSEMDDYGVSYYGDQIVFATPQKETMIVQKLSARNNSPFLELYTAFLSKEGSFENITEFYKNINTKYHESNVSITPDGQTMYYTSNHDKKSSKASGERTYRLTIYKTNKVYAKDSSYVWSNPVPVSFSNKEYSIGHPSVSADGTRLYFVSDMPGGYGQSDVYYAAINADGSFGAVTNAGKTINTEGREMFPFISSDNILYFSSDGHFGQGGLDIFESKLNAKNTFEKPLALSAPINSSADDFSFVLSPERSSGYFSSNREGGKGGDDIYRFTINQEELLSKQPEEVIASLTLKELEILEKGNNTASSVASACTQTVQGVITDKERGIVLSNTTITIEKSDGSLVTEFTTDASGKFTYELPCNENYTINASKAYYGLASQSMSTTSTASAVIEVVMGLNLSEDFTYNQNNELMIKTNPIYFDFNKANIRLDAKTELDRIVGILQKYPKAVVMTNAHTDARGSAAYNQRLSERRAASTLAYIVSKGISKDRITANGYGEAQLIYNCTGNKKLDAGTNCTEKEHQANRRSEFVVLLEEKKKMVLKLDNNMD